jgi:hypothetical protein
MVIKQEREIPSYLIFHASVDLLLFSLRHLVGIVISPGAPAGVTGYSECAGLNRHVVGDARALRERSKRLHPDL